MSRLSIIIPSLAMRGIDAVARLETTLLSVLENRPRDTDVLVAHAHDYADPYDLASEVQFLPVANKATYVAAVNAAIDACDSDIVHVLAAGCTVRHGWTNSVIRRFNDPRVAAVAPLVIDTLDSSRVLSASPSYTVGGIRGELIQASQDVVIAGVQPVLATGMAAAFFNRLTLETVGGLCDGVGAEYAGLDLGLLLKHAGFATLCDPQCVVERHEQPLEDVSRFHQAARAERMFWRNAPLFGWMRSLVAHPAAVLRDVFAGSPMPTLAGHATAMLEWSRFKRHHHRLKDLENAAPVLVHEPTVKMPQSYRLDGSHGTQEVARPTNRESERRAAVDNRLRKSA